ncbi:gastrula zinc finger protein XlCGF7.1-like [Limulus polyphemus]|uniref:Gastrula zinc finger protein XlCGF7.1-like n=1 Tax=Limulus polyphemus TaxID=6850 RepID=A0ABM1C3G7_LIMPO|nr:gastrula zinc finger protein XlCGF7.1-like [Limulus polyphemus]
MENNCASEKGLTRRKTQYFCVFCNYETNRKNNLKRHCSSMREHSSKILECCGEHFLNKAALRSHTKTLHKEGYICNLCTRSFCRRALLRRHMSVHNGLKEFYCELCIYATSHKGNLERHQFRIHGIPEKKHRKRNSVSKQSGASSSSSLGLSSREEESNGEKLSNNQSIVYTPELPDSTSEEPSITMAEDINRSETRGTDRISPAKENIRLCCFPYKCLKCNSVFKKQSDFISHGDQMHPPRDAFDMTLIHAALRHGQQAQEKPLNLVIHPQREPF